MPIIWRSRCGRKRRSARPGAVYDAAARVVWHSDHGCCGRDTGADGRWSLFDAPAPGHTSRSLAYLPIATKRWLMDRISALLLKLVSLAVALPDEPSPQPCIPIEDML